MSKVVIGLGFGDEGKGQTTSWLSSLDSSATVVRHSGGSQAGHNVVTEAGTHIFASFGSGTLNGNPTHLAHTCLVNPIHLMREYDLLVKCGFMPEISIHPECPLVTPFDVLRNQYDPSTRGHGTCGCGINETLRREEAHYSLTVGDLLVPGLADAKYEAVRTYYGMVEVQATLEFREAVPRMLEIATITDKMPEDIIYEGSQGLLLDKDIGIFPHVTPCNVGMRSNGVVWYEKIEAYYVTRAYGTRHGNGPDFFPPVPCPARVNSAETNKDNEMQGEFRRGMLNVDMLKYALSKDYPNRVRRKNLVVTCLEHMEDWEFWYEGEVCLCAGKKAFCSELGKILGMETVYMMENHKVTQLGDEDV